MNSGDLQMALCLLLVVFAVFYLWDTPRQNRKVKYIDSTQLAQMVARQNSRIKCSCKFLFACKPCSELLDRHDEAIQRGDLS